MNQFLGKIVSINGHIIQCIWQLLSLFCDKETCGKKELGVLCCCYLSSLSLRNFLKYHKHTKEIFYQQPIKSKKANKYTESSTK